MARMLGNAFGDGRLDGDGNLMELEVNLRLLRFWIGPSCRFRWNLQHFDISRYFKVPLSSFCGARRASIPIGTVNSAAPR